MKTRLAYFSPFIFAFFAFTTVSCGKNSQSAPPPTQPSSNSAGEHAEVSNVIISQHLNGVWKTDKQGGSAETFGLKIENDTYSSCYVHEHYFKKQRSPVYYYYLDKNTILITNKSFSANDWKVYGSLNVVAILFEIAAYHIATYDLTTNILSEYDGALYHKATPHEKADLNKIGNCGF